MFDRLTMFKTIAFSVISVLISLSSVESFVSSQNVRNPAFSRLEMMSKDEQEKRTAASFVAAAYLFANVFAATPALALEPMDFGSSEVVAGRSGGRAGGRASVGGRSAASYSRAPPPPTRTIERRTTVIQQAPTVIAPAPVMVAPTPFFAPPSALDVGLAVGVSAISNAANGAREYRQESEIARERAELDVAKQRQAELEARLRQLEAQQYAR